MNYTRRKLGIRSSVVSTAKQQRTGSGYYGRNYYCCARAASSRYVHEHKNAMPTPVEIMPATLYEYRMVRVVFVSHDIATAVLPVAVFFFFLLL